MNTGITFSNVNVIFLSAVLMLMSFFLPVLLNIYLLTHIEVYKSTSQPCTCHDSIIDMFPTVWMQLPDIILWCKLLVLFCVLCFAWDHYINRKSLQRPIWYSTHPYISMSITQWLAPVLKQCSQNESHRLIKKTNTYIQYSLSGLLNSWNIWCVGYP